LFDGDRHVTDYLLVSSMGVNTVVQCFTDKFTAAVRQKPNNESHIMLFCSALEGPESRKSGERGLVRRTVQVRHGVNTDQNTSLKLYNFCEIPPELSVPTSTGSDMY